MSRRFALVTVVLVAAGSFLVGLIVAGSLTPAPAVSRTTRPSSVPSSRDAARQHVVARQLRRRRRAAEPRGRQHRRHIARRRSRPSDSDSRAAEGRRRPPVGGAESRRRARRAAPRHGQRRHHRGRGLHPHEPPRHRARRADPGEAGRRTHAARRGRRLAIPDTDIALIKVESQADRFRPRRSAIPTRCAWASGCAPSATRWPTSTPSPSAS